MEKLEFKKIFPGVWRAGVDFQYPGYNYGGLLERAGVKPFQEGFDKQAETPFPFAEAPRAKQAGGKILFMFPFGGQERLYGLGLVYERLEQTLQVRHLRCDHYGGKDNGRTHVPAPFYVSDAGYGVFIDSASVISFYMGGSVRKDAKNPPPEKNRGRDADWQSAQRSEYVEVSLDGGRADVYIFGGASMADVVSRFNLLSGGGCLPPKWGLGMWQRVNIKYSAEEVKQDAAEFAKRGVPLSVIGLEPGWQSNSYPCTHEWDAERFPDPKEFLREMSGMGVRINLWENLYVSKSAKIYEKLKPYSGTHTVWGGVAPDLCLPEARNLMMDQHRRDHVAYGVSGYKIDECDGFDSWLWPDHAEFPSGVAGVEMRQVYAALFARALDGLYRSTNRRTYGLIRAANAGMSSFPYCIYNDCYDFRQYMTGLASTGFTGALWCPEIRGVKSAEEYVRRFQIGCVSPMLMINSWAERVTPWSFPEVENIIRDVIKLRELLLPYLYTAFADYRFGGLPPFRALCMDFSGASATSQAGVLDSTDNPYALGKMAEIVDQYMAGRSLMVAPVFTGNTRRDVFLPEGEWYDFYSGEALGGGKTISIDCPLEKLPLFVRGGEKGGVIPTMVDGTVSVLCYGEKGSGSFYDDDGLTYDFESGTYYRAALSFVKKGGAVEGTVTVEHDGYRPVPFDFMPIGNGRS
jgi:alpha-D-xyloside xylohydrolase